MSIVPPPKQTKEATNMTCRTIQRRMLSFSLLLLLVMVLCPVSICSFAFPADGSYWKNKIITCSSTKQLKEAIETCVHSHHVVAELGAQLRQVSAQICEQCDSAVLVDVERKFPKNQEPNDNVNVQRISGMRLETANDDDNEDAFYPDKANFLVIPKLQDWRQAFFPSSSDDDNTTSSSSSKRPVYDVLVLDVNAIVGNDLEWTSLSLIQEFQAQQPDSPLIILVKSAGLNQFASRLVYGKNYSSVEQCKAIPPPHILATVGVQEYRNTIEHVVRPEDAVLEVGCHFGTTTAILDEVGDYCIGVDVGSKIIAQAQNKYPHIQFSVGDAWKTAALLRIQQDFYNSSKQQQQQQQQLPNSSGHDRKIGFDVVFVDVGGLSGSDGLLEAIALVSSIRYALEPRCIVIKSLCMQRLSTKLVSFWHVQKKMKENQQS
jgi:SAM-dependent methyltransferase